MPIAPIAASSTAAKVKIVRVGLKAQADLMAAGRLKRPNAVREEFCWVTTSFSLFQIHLVVQELRSAGFIAVEPAAARCFPFYLYFVFALGERKKRNTNANNKACMSAKVRISLLDML
jgi:hypothetical protein